MDNTLIKLRSDARKAGVPNYGSMSRAELQDALKGSKPNKRKSAANVTGSKPKRKSATAVVADKPKRKPKRKAAVASSDMSEQRAKRIVRKYAGKRGRRPAEFYEAQAVLGNDVAQVTHTHKPAPKRKSASANQMTNRTATRSKPKASSNGNGGRNLIDRSAIDWKADWTGGQTGNRGKIMKALRKFKGDYAKVLAALKPDVTKMYPKSSKTGAKYSKAEALAMLKWHIGRTAFDFVTGTHQHEKATNRKSDKRSTGTRRKSAPAASDNGNVSEYSDAKLKKIVNAAAGRRGRKSAEVHAAMSELEKRAGGKGRAKVASSKPKPQASAGGRRKASTRKRVKA